MKPELIPRNIYWLALGIGLAGLPHWQRLPMWIPIIHILLIIARIYLPLKHHAFWSRQTNLLTIFRILMMFAGVVGIYGSYGTLAGRDVGVALLVLLAGLKVFESHNARDYYICTFLGYFLIITNFFYSQTIPTATYMLVVILIMTAGLIEFNDTRQQLSLTERLRMSLRLLIQALPLLLILFILFPRVNGPLWGLPKDAYTGITGIDDQMTPGTISKLVQSREVAFRVTFKDQIPEQDKLYWRGPVLWHTDGRKWTMGAGPVDSRPAPITYLGDNIEYDVTLEPTNKKWLFGLEMVTQLPNKTYLTHDHQLKNREPVRARKAYSLVSDMSYYFNSNRIEDIQKGLTLPPASHPLTQQLASRLRDEYQTPTKILQATLDWFQNEGFVYTLKPPLLDGDSVDQFLFNSRQGFCEHYAAAFTVLMRAAGIPARVVTGYLGGEINPLGNYLIVRQHHAHAWTEVWLDDKGWTRVDPTSVISTRVSEGIENSMPEAIIDIPLGLEQSTTMLRLWQRLRNTVDMVNYQWAQWVLGYSPERQQLFLQRLGFKWTEWKQLTMSLLILIGIIVAVIAVFEFKKVPATNDPAKKYYDQFCRKLTQIGLSRLSYEGPGQFAQRAITVRQDLEVEITSITNLYILIRYCSQYNKLENLKAEIQSFTPKKIIPISN